MQHKPMNHEPTMNMAREKSEKQKQKQKQLAAPAAATMLEDIDDRRCRPRAAAPRAAMRAAAHQVFRIASCACASPRR